MRTIWRMKQNVSLADYSTMRLGGIARYLVKLTDKNKLPELVAWAKEQSLPVMMIGEGSNIVWRDEGFDGLIVVNKLQGVEIEYDEDDAFVTIAAGEHWDSVVAQCCDASLNGIAELSLIPGTAGATPVQNVGAYGREIADVLVSVEAYDTETGEFVTIGSEDCGFDYRTSRFKTNDKGRYFITAILLQLSKTSPQPPYYQAVSDYLAAHSIDSPVVQDIRKAVIAIRSQKLPDPAIVANNGSFFANPIVSKTVVDATPALGNIRSWELEDGSVKLSAAALIEAAGFKDYHDGETGMATWPKQPLVFVNESAKRTADLLAFKQKVVDSVQQQFGITLEQEPELLP